MRPNEAADSAASAELASDTWPVLNPRWMLRLSAGLVAALVLGVEAATRGEITTATLLLGFFALYALAIAVWARVTAQGRGLPLAIGSVMCLEVGLLTAALLELGAVQGPLVGIYGLFVLGAGIAAGLRVAAIVATASALAYAAAVGAAASDLSDAWRSLLFGGVVIAAALYSTWTGAKLIRARARAAEDRYRVLFEAASDPIVVWDPANTRIIDVNRAAEAAAGLSRAEIIGSTGLKLIPIEQRPQVEERFQTRAYLEGPATHRYVRPDGDERFFKVSASPFRLGGQPAVVAVVSDLTDRYRLEQEQRRHAEELEREVELRTADLERVNRELRELQTRLLQAQRLSAAEDLAGSVVHAINNPLTALMGTVELALQSPHESLDLDRVLRLTHRIRDVVDRTLGLFRRGALNLQVESARALLDRALEELAPQVEARGLRAEVKVESDLPPLYVDRELISAALVGIAENAVEASAPGGHIWLEAESVPVARAVRLRISDQGSGIPPDLRERVLDPFFTTKSGGTGLGLAIARGVIRGHQGTLRIEDRPGGGASVAIDLPTRPAVP